MFYRAIRNVPLPESDFTTYATLSLRSCFQPALISRSSVIYSGTARSPSPQTNTFTLCRALVMTRQMAQLPIRSLDCRFRVFHDSDAVTDEHLRARKFEGRVMKDESQVSYRSRECASNRHAKCKGVRCKDELGRPVLCECPCHVPADDQETLLRRANSPDGDFVDARNLLGKL